MKKNKFKILYYLLAPILLFLLFILAYIAFDRIEYYKKNEIDLPNLRAVNKSELDSEINKNLDACSFGDSEYAVFSKNSQISEFDYDKDGDSEKVSITNHGGSTGVTTVALVNNSQSVDCYVLVYGYDGETYKIKAVETGNNWKIVIKGTSAKEYRTDLSVNYRFKKI